MILNQMVQESTSHTGQELSAAYMHGVNQLCHFICSTSNTTENVTKQFKSSTRTHHLFSSTDTHE